MRLSRLEFLSLFEMRAETLDAWIEEEWLMPGSSSVELTFSDIDVARTRLILELQADLGVNDEGIGVILHLVDQLHGMRLTLLELRDAVATGAEQI